MPNRELLQPRLPLNQIADGTSNTMMLAEGYAVCSQVSINGNQMTRYNDWINRSCEFESDAKKQWYDPNVRNAQAQDPYQNFQYWPEAIDQMYYFPTSDAQGNITDDRGGSIFYYYTADFGRIPTTASYVYKGYNQLPIPYAAVANNLGQAVTLAKPTFQNHPDTSNCSINMPQSLTPGSIVVAMADGSVRNISLNVSYSAWTAAITPNGNEFIDETFGE